MKSHNKTSFIHIKRFKDLADFISHPSQYMKDIYTRCWKLHVVLNFYIRVTDISILISVMFYMYSTNIIITRLSFKMQSLQTNFTDLFQYVARIFIWYMSVIDFCHWWPKLQSTLPNPTQTLHIQNKCQLT